ncbi:hypothetical protein Bcp1_041 [Bacillus phage Bcp1]|uniref:Uncharacterized protein n=3 Tax=Caeruleovirus TaxID=1911929 RepID=A0A0S2MU83_9CAUD|nr:hypothetical protein Bcp1_041 [Bacillus phage Bcp1]YP_009626602.1 hypothetical protein FD732_gp036 [Bacillus phage BM15]AHN66518.1 hypothetical protein Bcp1_041 [Bacillus phage Bcp1]ALO79457.1 hypothetical protein BM10_36 [Bacillus phage BM15]AXQ66817.1 hypothetical protein HOBO_36 [Bacillus phage Hobo]
MLEPTQMGYVKKVQVCDEVYNGVAQQWKEQVEIKRYEDHWFDNGWFKQLGHVNTETIIVTQRPKYIR